MRISRLLAAALPLAGSLLLLAGCGQAPAAPAPGAGNPAAGSTATDAPVQPKVNRLVMGMAPPAEESNAIRDLGVTVGWQLKPMYEYLVGIDHKTGKLVPQLATEWALENGGSDNVTVVVVDVVSVPGN